MEESKKPSLNTREFVIKWHATVDEHLVTRLADSVGQLAAAQLDGSRLDAAQCRILANHLVTALHLAADSSSGVPEAVDYLIQTATEGAGADHQR
jgi:hypothetical protein